MRELLQRIDTELYDIIELCNKIKDISPPDYGDLKDWSYSIQERKAALQNGGKLN